MDTANVMATAEESLSSVNTEALDKELRYQLGTFIGTATALLCFFIITFFLISVPTCASILPAPLIMYNLVKLGYCVTCLCCAFGPEKTALIKDLIECVIMIGYYVFIFYKMKTGEKNR